MDIEVFTGGPFETNSYILINDFKEALLVDPTFDSLDFFISELESKRLLPKGIILTHSHLDHIAQVFEVKEHYDVKIYIHEKDMGNLLEPGSDGLPTIGNIKGIKPDVLVEDNQKISVGRFEFTVLHTPGHSFGSVCYYFENEAILISGDTLFEGTYGNISFPTSEPHKMKDSLKRLGDLPLETVVMPGHGDPTTIGEENWLKNLDKIFN